MLEGASEQGPGLAIGQEQPGHGRPEEIVYGIDRLTGWAIYAPRAEAESVQRMFDVVVAKTWGEVRTILTPDELNDLKEGYSFSEADEDDPSYSPLDDEPFNHHAAGGYDDGDWPLTPIYSMLWWFPEDLIDRFGRVVRTTLNGDYLSIDAEHLEEVADELRTRGYTCVRDDDLVWTRL